jgi:prepilin peptidase CpaA
LTIWDAEHLVEKFFAFENGLVLLGTHTIELRIALLCVLVLIAVFFDVRSHRIPNWLVLAGLVIGIAYHSFLATGWGLAYSLKGVAVGFGVFFPIYLLRGMGAGDVKLMAMVGAFLGAASTLGAILMTLMAGGVLAITVALSHGMLPTMIANLRLMVTSLAVKAAAGRSSGPEMLSNSAGKLPYAVAIAAGTLIQVALAAHGNALIG